MSMMMIIVMIRTKMTIELLIIMKIMMGMVKMVWVNLENEVVALILLSKSSIFAFPPVIAESQNNNDMIKVILIKII